MPKAQRKVVVLISVQKIIVYFTIANVYTWHQQLPGIIWDQILLLLKLVKLPNNSFVLCCRRLGAPGSPLEHGQLLCRAHCVRMGTSPVLVYGHKTHCVCSGQQWCPAGCTPWPGHLCAGAQLVQPGAHWVIVLGRRGDLCTNYLCNWN